MSLKLPIKESLKRNLQVRLFNKQALTVHILRRLGLAFFWFYIALFISNAFWPDDYLTGQIAFWALAAISGAILIFTVHDVLLIRRYAADQFSFELYCLVHRRGGQRELFKYAQADSISVTNRGYFQIRTGQRTARFPLFLCKNRRAVLGLFLPKHPRRAYDWPSLLYFWWTKTILPAAIGLHIIFYGFTVYQVVGHSMKPTLDEGSLVLLQRSSGPFVLEGLKYPIPVQFPTAWTRRLLSDPPPAGLGDIIVIRAPGAGGADFPPTRETLLIKRVIGVAGDTYRFHAGKFFRNGIALNEDYVYDGAKTKLMARWVVNKAHPARVPEIIRGRGPDAVRAFQYGLDREGRVPPGCLLVMGDNRSHSLDSRHKGVGFIPYTHVYGKVIYF